MRFHRGLVSLLALLAIGPVAAQDEGLVMFPDTVEFGSIPVGGNYFGQFVHFENDTGGPIQIDSPYIGGQAGNPFAWFSNFIGQFTIADGSGLRYGARFAPPWEGEFEDNLCVPVTDLPNPCVHLRGRGIAPLSAEVAQGAATLTTSIPNPSTRPLIVTVQARAPWATPSPALAEIAPGDSLLVDIAIDATELRPGLYRDTLRVDAAGVYFDYELTYTVSVVEAVAGEGEAQPVGFSVGPAFPNPTGGDASIPLTLEAPAVVSVEAYDAQGRRVLDLGARPLEAGQHELVVDSGRLGGGLYHVHLVVRSGGEEAAIVRRIIVTR